MRIGTEATLGPFKIDPLGLLSPASPNLLPRFAVRFRDRLVEARMLAPNDAGSDGSLAIKAWLGRIPSTAAMRATSSRRADVLSVLQPLLRFLPKGWRLQLQPDHGLAIEALTPLPLPVSAIGLVTEMSLFLLTLQPYLDVLEEEGIDFAGGTANT